MNPFNLIIAVLMFIAAGYDFIKGNKWKAEINVAGAFVNIGLAFSEVK